MRGKGEGKFDVFSGSVLARSTEVVDKLVELLEREVGAPQFVDGGVCF